MSSGSYGRTMKIDRRPLSDRLAVFPRLGLADLPTPLEPMKRLTAHLGGPRLWVKREDATGLGFGGNKLRKLDYVLHDALANGADTIVSGGVVHSNSPRRNTRRRATRFSIGCSVRISTTCRGPVTATQPFVRSWTISKRAVT